MIRTSTATGSEWLEKMIEVVDSFTVQLYDRNRTILAGANKKALLCITGLFLLLCSLLFQCFCHRPADICGTVYYAYTTFCQDLHFRSCCVISPTNDGAGVSHTATRRGSLTCDKSDD